MSDSAKRALWITILVGAGTLFSLGLACATPFAALGAIAALHLSRRDALALVVAAWGLNQAIGYGVLQYPRSFDSYAWGLAIGASAVAGLFAARAALRAVGGHGFAAGAVASFAAAFVTYELVLLATSFVLGGTATAFAWPVVQTILSYDALAFAGLLVLGRLATVAGLVSERSVGGAQLVAA